MLNCDWLNDFLLRDTKLTLYVRLLWFDTEKLWDFMYSLAKAKTISVGYQENLDQPGNVKIVMVIELKYKDYRKLIREMNKRGLTLKTVEGSRTHSDIVEFKK